MYEVDLSVIVVQQLRFCHPSIEHITCFFFLVHELMVHNFQVKVLPKKKGSVLKPPVKESSSEESSSDEVSSVLTRLS